MLNLLTKEGFCLENERVGPQFGDILKKIKHYISKKMGNYHETYAL